MQRGAHCRRLGPFDEPLNFERVQKRGEFVLRCGAPCQSQKCGRTSDSERIPSVLMMNESLSVTQVTLNLTLPTAARVSMRSFHFYWSGGKRCQRRSKRRPAAVEELDSETVAEIAVRAALVVPARGQAGRQSSTGRADSGAREWRDPRLDSTAAPDLLRTKLRRAHGFLVALMAGGVHKDARGSRGLLVVACARGDLRVTPCSAQQRHVWRNRQCQHNRKYNCSEREHVMLNPLSRKKDATDRPRAGFKRGGFSHLLAIC